MNRISGLKHYVIYLLAITIIGVGVLFVVHEYLLHGGGKAEHQVFGQTKNIADNQIEISGLYLVDENPALTNYKIRTDFTIQFDKGTKFVKTIWHMPSEAVLAKSNNQFDPKSITKDRVPGFINDIKYVTGMPLTIKTVSNARDTNIYAQEIDYNTYIYAQ